MARDTLAEKEKLYTIVEEAIAKIKKDNQNVPTPELREFIALGLTIIEKIRDEKQGVAPNPEDKKREAFGEWQSKHSSKAHT